MKDFTDEGRKRTLDFTLDLDILKPYYKTEFIKTIGDMSLSRYKRVQHVFFLYKDSYAWNSSLFHYFTPKDNDYTVEKQKIVWDIILETTGIVHHLMEILWYPHYRFFFNSYKADENGNFVAKEIDDLQEIVRLYTMIDNISRSDIRMRFKDEFGNIDNKYTIELNKSDRLAITKTLLDNRLKKWSAKYLTAKDLSLFKRSINTSFKYGDNSPISLVIKKFGFITSQSILSLEALENLRPNTSLKYNQRLLEFTKSTWAWDKRACPLNSFNSEVISVIDRYIESKMEQHKDIFSQGLKKHKEHYLFSLLRIFNIVPERESLQYDKPLDAKEDYIKDLMKLNKAKMDKIKKN